VNVSLGKSKESRKIEILVLVVIYGSIGCALSLKIYSEAWTHVFHNTQKLFWEIPPEDNFIKIINYF